jgi:hypothetical protein
MARSDLLQSLQSNKSPKNLRMMAAKGLAPIPLNEMLELLISLSIDTDSEISSQAKRTIASWDEEDILTQLQSQDCAPSVLKHFGVPTNPDRILRAIIANPLSPESVLASLALKVPARLLEAILDNRARIVNTPDILENIRHNPSATAEILRLIQEIEVEFFGVKRKKYNVGVAIESIPLEPQTPELEAEIPLDDLSLEGLPPEGEERQAAISIRLSTLSVREKIRYALFGTREIRAVLIRDTNKEVARNVLHSPKLTENEIASIAAMRSVADDILREIGNSKEWTRSYAVVQNLVRNPKTPPLISQRLLNRLRSQDLALLTRDRSVSDAVRQNAARMLRHRNSTRAGQ